MEALQKDLDAPDNDVDSPSEPVAKGDEAGAVVVIEAAEALSPLAVEEGDEYAAVGAAVEGDRYSASAAPVSVAAEA